MCSPLSRSVPLQIEKPYWKINVHSHKIMATNCIRGIVDYLSYTLFYIFFSLPVPDREYNLKYKIFCIITLLLYYNILLILQNYTSTN